MLAGTLLAGVGGSYAGAQTANALGNSLGGDTTSQTPSFVNQMNKILLQAQQNALNQTNSYTQQAIGAQGQYLNAATNALNTGLTNATNAANQNTARGFSQSQALQAPYANAGYNALDAYQRSLGMQTPQGGSANLANNLFTGVQQAQAIQNFMAQNPNAPTNPGVAPDLLPTNYTLDDAIQGKLGVLPNNYGNYINSPGIKTWIQQNVVDPANQRDVAANQNSQATYNNNLNAYNTYNNNMSQLQFNPQALALAKNYGLLGGLA